MTAQNTSGAPAHDESVEVREDPDRHRFDILVGGREAGFSLYTAPEENLERQRIFFHAVIDDEFGGRGLAGILTRQALLTSVADGHRIVAVCPYFARWLHGHDDVADSVDRVRPEHLEAVRRANAPPAGRDPNRALRCAETLTGAQAGCVTMAEAHSSARGVENGVAGRLIVRSHVGNA